jgi:omega-hydroxy-beta-dihydromenaquinone-9 sulfotransferase
VLGGAQQAYQEVDEMTSAPTFIVGTPRSGTTLMARILGNHSILYRPGETHFMQDIYARRATIGDPATDPAAREDVVRRLRTLYGRYNSPGAQRLIDRLFATTDFADRLRAAKTYRDAFSTFMHAQAEAAQKQRWLNHVPRDLFELDAIFDLYPDCRVIVCIRHPLDFLASYREKVNRSARHSSPANTERLRRLYHPAAVAALWQSSANTVHTALTKRHDQIFLSRYEDLVADPSAQVRMLCDFIGVAFEPQMLAVDTNNSSYCLSERGIFSSAVGRWHSALPMTEAFIGQSICRRGMRRMGYTTEPVKPDWIVLCQHVVSIPVYSWRALTANAGRRGPTLPYLTKRFSALVAGRTS